ncbi:class I SAM-dependent methyltransferase [Isoptericola sp. S6320L]|uniref:class I SAM-dependent methyltransferase n=1 Tax=Isoptericola sp. S6320L TaxID=2926411 RepID=UPI001FF515AC|nr:class I SAM-dependent methyltransferase [Isoptericola sp. S6320L]MCK0116301.1 class I SAM-dependent methyltransferase [Isoptericola sp. S6320L]
MTDQNETDASPTPLDDVPSADVAALRAEVAELTAVVGDVSKRVRQMQRVLTIVNRQTREMPADFQAIQEFLARFPPRAALPAVGGWAMEPSALLWMVEHIARQRTGLVVECGSGTSTVWLARALQETGGRLVTFEHSEEFLAVTQAQLEAHGVADVVDLRHAPLVPTQTERGEFSWYDVDTAGLDEIGLLLVDGPPGNTGPLARYPAVPTFAGHLAEGAVVVVDDTSRRDERDMVDHWLSEQPRLRRDRQLGLNTEVLRVE